MCLAIPSKVIEVNEEENLVTVDTFGAERTAVLDLMPEPVEVGDYVLLHVGVAIRKIDEEYAVEALELYKQYLEEDEQKVNTE
jgi:hydrogenase expression/formation protein HypC